MFTCCSLRIRTDPISLMYVLSLCEQKMQRSCFDDIAKLATPSMTTSWNYFWWWGPIQWPAQHQVFLQPRMAPCCRHPFVLGPLKTYRKKNPWWIPIHHQKNQLSTIPASRLTLCKYSCNGLKYSKMASALISCSPVNANNASFQCLLAPSDKPSWIRLPASSEPSMSHLCNGLAGSFGSYWPATLHSERCNWNSRMCAKK